MVERLRDAAINRHHMLLQGEFRSPPEVDLQNKIARLSGDQKELMTQIVVDAVDVAIHDLLLAIQEAYRLGRGIDVLVDGVNIAEESGDLQGEHMGDGGWIDKFSRYREMGRFGPSLG